MHTKEVFLDYIEEYNAFGIKDEVIENLEEKGIVPLIKLRDDDLVKLSLAKVDKNAPKVGYLLGRETGMYTIDFNYAKSLLQGGVDLRFLTYKNNIAQMQGIDGLMLPGGRFESPATFYTDPMKKTDGKPGARSYAYITSIIEAEQKNMPILGVCAGAQMLAGMHGMRMYRNVKEYTHTNLEHRTKDVNAHEIFIYPDNMLYNLLGGYRFIVNSRHTEAVMNNDKISDLQIFAAAPDGTPEAWGNEDKKILCIQWHPEDFAANGDEHMQKIYNWLAKEAKAFKHQKENTASAAYLFNRSLSK